MIYCGMCGSRMEEGDEFCPECGKRTERKKKRILKNKFISGRGLVTDYRGVVIKICVILVMLTVTGNLIWGEEMAINMMNSAATVQWKTIVSSEKNLISMYVELIKCYAYLIAGFFEVSAIYIKIWSVIYVFCSVWLGIVSFFAVWRLFEKAGIQGWKMLIPIYNIYCVSRIVFKKGWLLFVASVGLISVMVLGNAMYMPILYIIPAILVNLWFAYSLSKRYEHGWGYTLGLLFFPAIFIVLLGWGNEQYVD